MTIFLTPTQLATRLHKKLSTLQSWRIRGGGPEYIKTGHRTILYRLVDVEAWENQRRFNSVAEEKAGKIAKPKLAT